MKTTTILIEGEPFTYNDEIEDITYDNIDPITKENAINLLKTTKTLFGICDIRFCLAYGTLLGAVREKSIIESDEDLDVFIESEDVLRRNLPFLYKNGLRVCRIVEECLYTFRTNNSNFIDVYIKSKLPTSIWSLWCDSINGIPVPRRYISSYDKIEFLGDEYLCPHKPERILAFWYGKDWRTPVRGHHFTYDVPSHYWWVNGGKIKCERFVANLKKPVKFIIGWKYWKKYVKP